MKDNIGKYDIAKGIGVLCVVLQHTIGLFDFNSIIDGAKDMNKVAFSLLMLCAGIQILFRNVVMPLFFVISGMGFRPATNKKAVKKYARFLVKPYICVGLITTVLFGIIHFLCFHYWKGSLIEAVKVLISFLIVQASNANYGDIIIYANGPAWFLIVLFIAWMVLSLVYKVSDKESVRGVLVGGLSLVGIIIAMIFPTLPLGIAQSLIASGYLYLGYLIKKKDLLNRNINKIAYCIMALIALVSVVFGNVDFGYNIWKLGPVDFVGAGCFAFFIIKFIGWLNGYNNLILEGFRRLGAASLWIICIHSVEMIAVPWYLVRDKYVDNLLVGFVIVFVSRIIIIFVGNKLVGKLRKIRRRANN